MTTLDNTFYRKDGTLTKYALACGYVEKMELDTNNRVTLYQEHSTFHIVGFFKGERFWLSYDNDQLSQARKDYRLKCRQLKAMNVVL